MDSRADRTAVFKQQQQAGDACVITFRCVGIPSPFSLLTVQSHFCRYGGGRIRLMGKHNSFPLTTVSPPIAVGRGERKQIWVMSKNAAGNREREREGHEKEEAEQHFVHFVRLFGQKCFSSLEEKNEEHVEDNWWDGRRKQGLGVTKL